MSLLVSEVDGRDDGTSQGVQFGLEVVQVSMKTKGNNKILNQY